MPMYDYEERINYDYEPGGKYYKQGGTMTKEDIFKLLDSNRGAVARAIEVIYDRQEADEKAEGVTRHENSVGFNGADAQFGSDLGRQIKERRAKGAPYKHCLTSKQRKAGHKMIKKYWRQLIEEAERKNATTK